MKYMAITVEVKVIPSSGRVGWMRDKSGMLKCFLKSPPEQGQANEELLKIVAKALGVPVKTVTIISGYQSRKKVIKIDAAITQDAFLHAIGMVIQKTQDRQVTIFD